MLPRYARPWQPRGSSRHSIMATVFILERPQQQQPVGSRTPSSRHWAAGRVLPTSSTCGFRASSSQVTLVCSVHHQSNMSTESYGVRFCSGILLLGGGGLRPSLGRAGRAAKAARPALLPPGESACAE